ncbi:hypothetical protein AXF42_Ash013938 [Apostasia shenzhenica]|uniref:Uncharacterized protein n=1 Tax=Apostasia shenzhenica TaxID=1088818 RepID=A0A2I0ASB8_9ASPA|nr:hypothetical protein AXF42_Ash013938 [Apostasia shenzhenica]
MAHVSDIKLIRTDTTLDLSQKAEKGMSLLTASSAIYNEFGFSSFRRNRCGTKVVGAFFFFFISWDAGLLNLKLNWFSTPRFSIKFKNYLHTYPLNYLELHIKFLIF